MKEKKRTFLAGNDAGGPGAFGRMQKAMLGPEQDAERR